MRIDRLLCCLRFTRTRGVAQKLIEQGHIRLNGERVVRASREIRIGDILTLPLGKQVRLVEVVEMPERRGGPRDAQACYRDLDPGD